MFHEEPQVLHYGRAGTGIELKEGMIFTIEPMINQGRPETRLLGDGWTAITKDRKLSAQWEHTVLVTADGYGDPHPAQRRNLPAHLGSLIRPGFCCQPCASTPRPIPAGPTPIRRSARQYSA